MPQLVGRLLPESPSSCQSANFATGNIHNINDGNLPKERPFSIVYPKIKSMIRMQSTSHEYLDTGMILCKNLISFTGQVYICFTLF